VQQARPPAALEAFPRDQEQDHHERAEDGALVRDVEAHRRRDWCGIAGSRHGLGHAHAVASVIVAVAPS
jgi:hypothetical protein